MKLVHVPALDGLRGIAVLAVIFLHARWLPGGAAGVDVFFVLSGYLITGICQQEIDRTGTINLLAFMSRRGRRLLPALVVVLGIYAVLAPILVPQFAAIRWIEIALAASYTMNLMEAFASYRGALTHTWSLAVEMQFYLAWPLLLLTVRRLGRERTAALLLILWVAITGARLAWLLSGRSDDVAYFLTPFHATGLLLGSALALRPIQLKLGWPYLAALALAAVIPHVPETFGWAISLAEISTAALICSRPPILKAAPLVQLGGISYGVYLWHIPVWHALRIPNGPVKTMLLVSISIVLAATSYALIERQFLINRGRSRLQEPRTTPVSHPV